jgi:hypothetical protein
MVNKNGEFAFFLKNFFRISDPKTAPRELVRSSLAILLDDLHAYKSGNKRVLFGMVEQSLTGAIFSREI